MQLLAVLMAMTSMTSMTLIGMTPGRGVTEGIRMSMGSAGQLSVAPELHAFQRSPCKEFIAHFPERELPPGL